jgi:hypothetical protein
MTTKHLIAFVLIVGSSAAMAFCPSGPGYWDCWEREMQQQRQQRQLNEIQQQEQQQQRQQQQQQQRQQQQQGQPLRCFRDSWGNVKCYE